MIEKSALKYNEGAFTVQNTLGINQIKLFFFPVL